MFKKFSLCACALLMTSLFSAQAAEPLKVCAVPQMHSALSVLQRKSPVPFETLVATPEELYARIANSADKVCDVLISADERLPSNLIKSGKADQSTLTYFAKAPLILWSPNPRMFRGDNALQLFKNKAIETIAIAKDNLTPVGFATSQVLDNKNVKYSYLRDYTFKSDHEYQVHAMVSDGHVQCGFITLPLVSSLTRQSNGSWWTVPESWYDPIKYNAIIFNDSTSSAEAQSFVHNLQNDEKTRTVLDVLGLKAL